MNVLSHPGELGWSLVTLKLEDDWGQGDRHSSQDGTRLSGYATEHQGASGIQWPTYQCSRGKKTSSARERGFQKIRGTVSGAQTDKKDNVVSHEPD